MLLLGVLQAQAAGAVGAGSFDLLETRVLESAESSVTFSSLSTYAADYQHLQIRMVARSTRAAVNENMRIQFNNDTGSNYSRHQLRGSGSSVISEAATSQTSAFIATICAASNTANSFTGVVTDLLDPFESTKNTTARTLHGSHDFTEIALTSGAWFNTASVTEIDLVLQSGGSFATGSRFSLYGIKAGS